MSNEEVVSEADNKRDVMWWAKWLQGELGNDDRRSVGDLIGQADFIVDAISEAVLHERAAQRGEIERLQKIEALTTILMYSESDQECGNAADELRTLIHEQKFTPPEAR